MKMVCCKNDCGVSSINTKDGLCVTCYVDKFLKTTYGQWLENRLYEIADEYTTPRDVRDYIIEFVHENMFNKRRLKMEENTKFEHADI